MLKFEQINAAVANLLEQTPNPTDEEIHALALHLAALEYENAIRSRLGRNDEVNLQYQLHAENDYWVFVESQKPLVKVSEGKGDVVMERPAKQSYKVKAKHLAAFCKQFGLDEKAMRAVGMGERYEYKGWTRGTGMGGQYELGQHFKQPIPIDPPLKTEQKAVRVKRPWSLPTQEWTPAED